MASERESKLQEKCLKIIRHYGGYVYKNAQNIYTEKGRPDLTACVPVTLKRLTELFGEDSSIGVFVGLELKRPGHIDEVSSAQEIVGRKIKAAEGLWLAIDDADLVEALMLKLRS